MDYQAAIDDYTKVIELNPQNTVAYYNRGLAFIDKKNYDLALADFEELIRLQPDDANAYYRRGNGHSSLGNKSAAIEDYQKAAELYQKQGEDKGLSRHIGTTQKASVVASSLSHPPTTICCKIKT